MLATRYKLKIRIPCIVGLAIVFLLCGVVLVATMSSLMIGTTESTLGFDETVAERTGEEVVRYENVMFRSFMK